LELSKKHSKTTLKNIFIGKRCLGITEKNIVILDKFGTILGKNLIFDGKISI
jgi:hypothetical protein